jgi:O-antigen/teichoic acid export membrane protein
MTALNNKTRIFLNSLIVSGVAILEKLFFFIINIVVARYLNVNDFGEYTTALGYATFFSTFVNIGKIRHW